AEVQARPNAGVDDLLERVRKSVEVARFAWEAGAYHAEPDLVRAEEHLQHLKVRAVATEVPRWVLGVRRCEKRCPGGVGVGVRIAVLVRPLDRRPRTPEVPIVLVVPAVDRSVRGAQVQHREEEGAVTDVDGVLVDQVPGDAVPRQRRRGALPENRDVRLLRRATRAVYRAERLDLV